MLSGISRRQYFVFYSRNFGESNFSLKNYFCKSINNTAPANSQNQYISIQIMNKFSLFILLLITMLSCGKDDNTPQDTSDNFLRAKIDGKLYTCNDNIIALGTKTPPHTLAISGLFSTSPASGITLIVNFNQNTNQLQVSSSGNCIFQDICHILQVNFNEGLNNEELYTSGYDDGTNMNVDFTTLNYAENGQLKGTFSGKLYDDDLQKFVNVTEGEFSVKLTLE